MTSTDADCLLLLPTHAPTSFNVSEYPYREGMATQTVKPREIDHILRDPSGRRLRPAKEGQSPLIWRPDGEDRSDEAIDALLELSDVEGEG